MLTIQELRQLQEKDLNEELTRTSRELMKAKMDHSSKTLKETHQLKTLKRYIARVTTITKENETETRMKAQTEDNKKN
jgi:ribosomal protein L29